MNIKTKIIWKRPVTNKPVDHRPVASKMTVTASWIPFPLRCDDGLSAIDYQGDLPDCGRNYDTGRWITQSMVCLWIGKQQVASCELDI